MNKHIMNICMSKKTKVHNAILVIQFLVAKRHSSCQALLARRMFKL